MSNRSPSVSPLASPLRRMQAAGLTGRINPYCSRRANFRSVKDVKACLAAISDPSMVTRKIKPPSSIHAIRTPPNRRSTHNVITPEARSMMKEAIAEFSSPLTDVKKIPIRDSPLFPIPASKRRKLFDMRDNILREVELKQTELKKKKNIDKNDENDLGRKDIREAPIILNADQQLQKIQELYPEFRFSNPISLKSKPIQKPSHNYDGEFVFSNTFSANVINPAQENAASELESKTPTEQAKLPPPTTNISVSIPTLPAVTIDKELAARFRPPEGSWECDDCMINNKSDVNICVACSATRKVTRAMQSQPKIHVEPDKELAARFRMGSDKWECSTCMIQNKQSDSKCLACDEPKPGTEVTKGKESKTILPLFTGTKTSGTIVPGQFTLKPGIGSGSTLFQGFSLTTNPTENKTNPLSSLITLNPTANPILGIPSIKLPITSNNQTILPIASTVPVISTSILPATGNTANCTNPIQLTNPTAITTTSLTTAKSTADTPAIPLPLPFPSQGLTPQSRDDNTTTTSSLSITQSTPSLQPIVMPPFSPPRNAHLAPPMQPLTPQKSVEEEAMEVIPFIGTLTTPVKGSSSQPANSPFSFQLNNPTNPLAPIQQVTPPNFSAVHSQAKFPGIQPVANSFLFSKTEIPQSFSFASGVTPVARKQTRTDDSTGQKMKPFLFKSSSQPPTQFPSANSSGIPQPNSQPEKLATPLFPTNQAQVQSSIFTPQGKQTTSLFPTPQQPQQLQQQQQQQSNFGFPSPVIPGPSMFNADPSNPSTNLFNKQTNVFSPNQKSTFQFSATGNTPHTPTGPFAFSAAPQSNTPTTPQTPTYANFNIGSNQPSSDVSKRVIKTAKRRLPHK